MFLKLCQNKVFWDKSLKKYHWVHFVVAVYRNPLVQSCSGFMNLLYILWIRSSHCFTCFSLIIREMEQLFICVSTVPILFHPGTSSWWAVCLCLGCQLGVDSFLFMVLFHWHSQEFPGFSHMQVLNFHIVKSVFSCTASKYLGMLRKPDPL